MGSWVWEEVAEGLRARGHSVHPVTLSGLAQFGEDVSEIGIDRHVEDVESVVGAHGPGEVILVSHSTSGLVAGVVADRRPDLVVHSVYVEAFVPRDGHSAIDAFGEPLRAAELRLIGEHEGRWPTPDMAAVADGQGLTADQAKWLTDRLLDHPGRPLTEPIHLSRPVEERHATYVVCALEHFEGRLPPDVERLRSSPTWRFRTLDTGIWPMVSAPGDLVALLDEVAAEVEGHGPARQETSRGEASRRESEGDRPATS